MREFDGIRGEVCQDLVEANGDAAKPLRDLLVDRVGELNSFFLCALEVGICEFIQDGS